MASYTQNHGKIPSPYAKFYVDPSLLEGYYGGYPISQSEQEWNILAMSSDDLNEHASQYAEMVTMTNMCRVIYFPRRSHNFEYSRVSYDKIYNVTPEEVRAKDEQLLAMGEEFTLKTFEKVPTPHMYDYSDNGYLVNFSIHLSDQQIDYIQHKCVDFPSFVILISEILHYGTDRFPIDRTLALGFPRTRERAQSPELQPVVDERWKIIEEQDKLFSQKLKMEVDEKKRIVEHLIMQQDLLRAQIEKMRTEQQFPENMSPPPYTL